MRKKDVRQEYRRWKFWDKVPLITKDQQWKHYFDNKFDNIDIDVDVNVDTKPIEDVVESTIENMLETAFNSESISKRQKTIFVVIFAVQEKTLKNIWIISLRTLILRKNSQILMNRHRPLSINLITYKNRNKLWQKNM